MVHKLLLATLLLPLAASAQDPRQDPRDRVLKNTDLIAAAPIPTPTLSPRQIYEQDGPAVVVVMAADKSGVGELGTGSVIDSKGHLLTNAHVVIQEATGEPYPKIHIYLKPAKITGDPSADLTHPYDARVVRYDRALDLALLEAAGLPAKTPVMSFGDSDAAEPGEPVVAIGHPEQGGLWTLTTGVISTMISGLGDVPGKDVFQTDASINRGNSGGPLIARDGRLIGVNTSMARKAKDGLAITSVNFSIKSNVARKWLAGGSEVALAQAPAASQAPVALQSAAPVSAPAAAAPTVAPAATPSAPSTPAAPAPQAPAAQAPAPSAPAVAQAPKPAAPAQKPAILTPRKPYRIENLLQKEMAEMEDLEKEMQNEIDRRRTGN